MEKVFVDKDGREFIAVRDGKRESIEDCFWGCIDEAIEEWDMQSKTKPNQLTEMGEIGRHAYMTHRLIIKLANILALARRMPRNLSE